MALVSQQMEKIKHKLGIFILNYNGLEWLQKSIVNILNNSPNTDVIIIDNNSQDQSINYIKQNFPEIKLIEHKKNYGFSKGYNKVLLNKNDFNYDYFIIMNNDVLVEKNWLTPIHKLIIEENIGIIQPKIKNLKKNNMFDYAGACGGFIDIMGIPFCRGRLLNTLEKDNGQYDENIDIFWASGCCLIIESNLFHELNGFDEDFYMYQEEIDLCWRAQSSEKIKKCCPQSVVYHYGSGTLKEKNNIKHFYNHRNNILLLLKNMNIKWLIKILPIRIIMDYLIIMYYFISGISYMTYTSPLYLHGKYRPNNTNGIEKIKTSFLIISAHISIIFLLPKMIKKRMPIVIKKIYPRSIILDYYFNQKKAFSQLKKF